MIDVFISLINQMHSYIREYPLIFFPLGFFIIWLIWKLGTEWVIYDEF